MIQNQPFDPTTRTGGFEHLMTTWANSLAAEHSLTLLAVGDENTTYHNSGESFPRVITTPDDLASTLRALSRHVDVVTTHVHPERLVPLDVPVSVFRHNPTSALRTWLAEHHPDDADERFEESVRRVNALTRYAAPSVYARNYDAGVFTIPGDVVYPFVPASLVTRPRAVDQHLALWLGRPIRRKGLAWLYEHHDEWSFPFAWAGSLDVPSAEPDVVELARSHAEPLTSPSGIAAMAALYSRVPVVLCPYLEEPFGMVIPEALTAGCRVVAFDSGGPAEMRGLPGLTLVEPFSVPDFDAAVVAALASPPLSADARHEVLDSFTVRSSAAMYIDHLERAAFAHGV